MQQFPSSDKRGAEKCKQIKIREENELFYHSSFSVDFNIAILSIVVHKLHLLS